MQKSLVGTDHKNFQYIHLAVKINDYNAESKPVLLFLLEVDSAGTAAQTMTGYGR